MASGQAAEIARALIQAGRSPNTPTALVENASLPGERRLFFTLAELAAGRGAEFTDGPVLMALGEIFRDALRQFQSATETHDSQRQVHHRNHH